MMLYELRIYECVPGRLPDLMKRFDTITLKLWEKHGIKQAGFWTTVIGEFESDVVLLRCLGLARRAGKEVECVRRQIRNGSRPAPRPRRMARLSPT